ncbi:MAG: 16S rRNA (guanine(527)-N(7))-methyltransferase RsmG [Bacilli bacterium]|nr:16S rRNA (guanine(527)-N(7))-methyltransferase RsmG [Bacilli bacterium]
MKLEQIKEIEFLDLNDAQIDKLFKYMNFTLEENSKFNLTRNYNKESFIIKNLIDSLLIVKDNDLSNSLVLDLGSGAGLPGIPLAIYYETTNFVLLEPTKKRAQFLERCKELLGLKNVTVVAERAEDYINDNNREKFDFVVSRAVSKLNVLLELSIPFLKVDGKLIAYKGLNYNQEIEEAKNSLKTLSSEVKNVQENKLPFSNETRFNIVVTKREKTNPKFPRLYKDISKKPL